MSRLDQHVAAVQRKLTLDIFLRALAWGGLALSVALVVGVILRQAFSWPVPALLLWVGGGLTVAAALGWALLRRPDQYQAAVAIDRKLSTKDKFATALYARRVGDPMAQAAVRDAEFTADAVRVRGKFRLSFPRPSLGIPGLLLVALLAQWYVPRDILGKKTEQQKQQREIARTELAKQQLAAVKVSVQQAIPLELAKSSDDIKRAMDDLERLKDAKDPVKAKNSALEPLKELDKALSKEIEKNKNWSDNQNLAKTFRNLKTDNEKGPIAEAARDMARGQFDEAMKQVEEAAKNFEKMPPEEKKKATDQMAKLAEQLKNMADNPAGQEQIQRQAESLGADPKQAGELAKAIKKAADGDPQAQKQIEEMAKQLSEKMNDGKGPTEKQKQAMDNLMKQMQSQASAQSQAKSLSEAAQKMAGAMQGASGAKGQQMADASKAMADALGQMQAIQSDAQQLAAARDAVREQMRQMSQGEGDSDSAGSGSKGGDGAKGDSGASMAGAGQGQGQGNSSGNGQGQGQGQGNGTSQAGGVSPWGAGNPQGQGNGTGGPGMGSGTGVGRALAPWQSQAVFSQSQDNEKGRNLASVYVQADTIKGESKQALHDVAAAQQRLETDEVDTAHIDRRSRDAIEEYFRSMGKDAGTKPD